MTRKLNFVVFLLSLSFCALSITAIAYAENTLEQITQEEQLWLNSHPIIRVGVDRDFAPYEWIDKEGQYVGLAADYMALLEQRLGVKFEIIHDKPWHEIQAMAQRGEIDMLSCLNHTPERAQYLNFTQNYVANPIVIVNADRNGYIGSLKKLAGKTVAIEQGYFTHENLAKNYPQINLLIVESTSVALEKVATGDADAYVGDAAYANYAIKQANLLNLQFAGQTPDVSTYRIGVRKDSPELLSVINKVLSQIQEQDRAAIQDKWMGLTVNTGIDSKLLINTAIISIPFFLLLFYHIYQLRKSKLSIQKNADRLKLYGHVFTDAIEGITITDADRVIIDVNPAFSAITGYNREEAIGVTPQMFRAESDILSPDVSDEIWASVMENGYWQGEIWNRKKNGEMYAEALTISALIDESGQTKHYVGLFSDITESKHQQGALEKMAHYDELTQLPNRTLFADRFAQAISHSNRQETLLAVCFLDLDDFKPINDTHGHEVGDQLLIEVADRIKSCLRAEDTVSRLGGDEFALLFNNVNSIQQCDKLIARVQQAVTEPFIFSNKSLIISASCGITLYPVDDSDPDTLLRHADQAMYQAKLAGRNCHRFYDALQDKKISQQHSQLQDIITAFKLNQFSLYFQPQVNMKTGEVLGAEALIRWIHPEKGIIPPLSFLPIIEDTDLEISVGNWVIEQALVQLNIWHKNDINIEVSVNISSRHLQWDGLVDLLAKNLAKYPDISPHFLQLEIIESSILGDVKQISNIVNSCKNTLGIRIALDDFGTGYSSLSHLRHLPVNMVKIDQSFVRDLLDDPNDYAIIDGVIGLSKAFHREVIAEGVETTDHGLILMMMGCDLAQGYGIAKPIPPDDFISWFKDYSPNTDWLDHASQDLSPEQSLIKLMDIELKRWKQRIEENLLSEEKAIDWPTVNHEQGHYYRWIELIQHQQEFSSDWTANIEKTYGQLHQIGHAIKTQIGNNEIDKAKSSHKELCSCYDTIQSLLNEYS